MMSAENQTLSPFMLRQVDAIDLELLKIQSSLVGHLFQVGECYYRARVSRHFTDDCKTALNVLVDVVGISVGVALFPDFSRGWLGDNQVTPSMLENPQIAAIYEDYLAQSLPTWIANVKFGETLCSFMQVTVTLVRIDFDPAEPEMGGLLKLVVMFEQLQDLRSIVTSLKSKLVLTEEQRLDSFQIELPLVAASVTLSSEELASLVPLDVIRIT